MSFLLERNVRLYVSNVTSGFGSGNTNKISILSGHSFNQASRTVFHPRNTIDAADSRTVEPVVEQVDTVDFTFLTYMDVIAGGTVTCPEEYLWQGLIGTSAGITADGTSIAFDFQSSDIAALNDLTIWTSYGDAFGYRFDNCTINSATIRLSLDDIPIMEWKGSALTVTEVTTFPTATDRTALTECLVNKVSVLTIRRESSPYNSVALVGGNLNINNNNVYYGRRKLGETTQPVGHYTSHRSITGSVNMYLKTTAGESKDILTDIIADSLTTDLEENVITYDLTVDIGGSSTPRINVNLPRVMFNIPSQNFDNVVTLRTPFVAKTNATSGDEVLVEYFA